MYIFKSHTSQKKIKKKERKKKGVFQSGAKLAVYVALHNVNKMEGSIINYVMGIENDTNKKTLIYIYISNDFCAMLFYY